MTSVIRGWPDDHKFLWSCDFKANPSHHPSSTMFDVFVLLYCAEFLQNGLLYIMTKELYFGYICLTDFIPEL